MLKQIKKDFLQARKDRDQLTIALLSTFIGDAEAIGKNDGNRETTDSEVIALLKKYIKNADEVLKVCDNENTRKEKAILEAYLPVQFTEEQLRIIIEGFCKEMELNQPKQMGLIMKTLKERYDGQYDGAIASKLAKEVLS